MSAHKRPDRTLSSTPLVAGSRLLRLHEAAQHLGVSVRTLRRWISQGRLTAFRVGLRAVRVDATDLEDLPKRIPTVGGELQATAWEEAQRGDIGAGSKVPRGMEERNWQLDLQPRNPWAETEEEL